MSWFAPKVNFQALLAHYGLPNDGTPPPDHHLAYEIEVNTGAQETTEQTNLSDVETSLIPATSYSHAPLIPRDTPTTLMHPQTGLPPTPSAPGRWNHQLPTGCSPHEDQIDEVQTRPSTKWTPINIPSEAGTAAHPRPRRIFNPEPYINDVTGMSIAYNSLLGITTIPPKDLTTVEESSFYNTLVIETTGITQTIKRVTSHSYGVFYGPSSPNNQSGILPATEFQSNRNSGIYAAILALRTLWNLLTLRLSPVLSPFEQEMFMLRNELKLVVLTTDNLCLGNDLEVNVWEMIEKGFVMERGRKIVLRPLMKELHELVCGLEKNGVKVQVWNLERK